jgi:phosphate-selective porin OprO/OprP
MKKSSIILPALALAAGVSAQTPADSSTSTSTSGPTVKADPSGLLLRSSDSAYSIRFRGVVRSAATWDLNDPEGKTIDQFQNQTVRLGFEGALARIVNYKIQADFSQGSVALQDAYTEIRFDDAFKVLFGKFQVPLGWERYIAPGDLDFYNRALPSDIAPNRDVGVQVSGDLFGKRLQYALAAVNGGADGSNINGDVNGDKDGYARIWTSPGKGSGIKWLEGLGFGVAGSFGNHDITLASYKSAEGQSNVVSTPFFSWLAADSSRGEGWRIAPQASWTAGPFWIWGEWIRSVEQVYKGSTTTAASYVTDSVGTGSSDKGELFGHLKAASTTASQPGKDLGVTAWQAGASWVVTGEDASEQGVTPRHPTRISGLSVDDAAFPLYADTGSSARAALAWAVAANWHLIKGTRLQVSYERTSFEGGATYVAGYNASTKSNVLALRDRKAENQLAVVASTSF